MSRDGGAECARIRRCAVSTGDVRYASAILLSVASACSNGPLADGRGDAVIDGMGPEAFDALYGAVKAELVEAPNAEEKAKRLTAWIARNSVNYEKAAADLDRPGDRFQALPFYGLCGERGGVFQALARRAGLTAGVFNIYNFGRVGGGHTAVLVRYGGEWHYFDPTYAGWFEGDFGVLTFEEIRRDPARALRGMVVVPGIDYWRGAPVANDFRMRTIYTEAALADADSTSLRFQNREVPIELSFDAERLPVHVGWPDATPEQMHWHGVALGISERTGIILANDMEHFRPTFQVRGARPGRAYALRFTTGSAVGSALHYLVTTDDADADVDRLHFDEPPVGGDTFAIHFVARSSEPRITISHELSRGDGIFLEGLGLTAE